MYDLGDVLLWITGLILVIIVICACCGSMEPTPATVVTDNGDYILIEEHFLLNGTNNNYKTKNILVDKNTGIMYIDGKPMYNEDGSFKIYDGGK